MSERDFRSEDGTLRCPVCGDNWIHIESVRVTTDKQNVHVDHRGVLVDSNESALSHAKNNRGAIVRLVIWCENGHHRSTIELAFHKGETLVDVDWEESPDVVDLWRD